MPYSELSPSAAISLFATAKLNLNTTPVWSIREFTQCRNGVSDNRGIAVDQKVVQELNKAAPLGLACVGSIQLGYTYCRHLAHKRIAVFEVMADLLGQVLYDNGDGYIRHGANHKRADEWIAVVAVLDGDITKHTKHKKTGTTIPGGSLG